MTKFYANRTWLVNQYIMQGKTAAEIAKICGTTEMTISRWLRKHGITKNIN